MYFGKLGKKIDSHRTLGSLRRTRTCSLEFFPSISPRPSPSLLQLGGVSRCEPILGWWALCPHLHSRKFHPWLHCYTFFNCFLCFCCRIPMCFSLPTMSPWKGFVFRIETSNQHSVRENQQTTDPASVIFIPSFEAQGLERSEDLCCIQGLQGNLSAVSAVVRRYIALGCVTSRRMYLTRLMYLVC